MGRAPSLGQRIVDRINQPARILESPEYLYPVLLAREHRAAAELILGWMREAGMHAHLDAIGNACGRYEGTAAKLPYNSPACERTLRGKAPPINVTDQRGIADSPLNGPPFKVCATLEPSRDCA